jgi:hypothetical protein
LGQSIPIYKDLKICNEIGDIMCKPVNSKQSARPGESTSTWTSVSRFVEERCADDLKPNIRMTSVNGGTARTKTSWPFQRAATDEPNAARGF